MIAFLAVVIGISGISLRLVVRGLRPVLFIIAFTAVLNLFYTPSATGEYLWQWGFLHISWEGVKVAFFMVLRLMLLIIATSMLTYTTSPIQLTDGLERLLISAQKARGADFDSGNLIQRAKAMIPILVPLFISAFRRADELATAMECRLYRGDVGRTRMKQLHIERVDICACVIFAVVIGAVIALGRYGL